MTTPIKSYTEDTKRYFKTVPKSKPILIQEGKVHQGDIPQKFKDRLRRKNLEKAFD